MHFIDLVKQSINDFGREQERLRTLFEKKVIYSNYGTTVLKNLIANEFCNSRFRGTYVGLDDLLESNSSLWHTDSLDGLLFYCETLENLIYEVRETLQRDMSVWSVVNQVLDNIRIIVNKTNHEIKHTDAGIIIIRKDALTAVAVEDIFDQNVAMAILEYNHNGIQGNLEKKKRLLAVIGKYVEPLTQKSGLKNEYPGLVGDVTFCLNNLDIRHNNKDGNNAKPFLETISDDHLEELYDGAYRSMLLLIEIEAHKEFHSKTKPYRKA